MERSNVSSLFVPIIQVSWAFASVAFFCALGQKVTDRFGVFNTELYRSEWYIVEVKMQRMLLIFMLDSQRPVYIQGNGHILCIRENFKKVDDDNEFCKFISIHF